MSRVLFVVAAAALLAAMVLSRSAQAEDDRSWVTCPGLLPAELRPTKADGQAPIAFVLRGELPGDFSLRAYTTVPGDLRVEFLVDGEVFATENHAPYSLFGDDGYTLNRGSLEARPTILTAIVYHQGDAVALASASTMIAPRDTCASPTPAPPNPNEPGDSQLISFEIEGSPPNDFTLRADAALSVDVRVEFEVGDELFAIENNPPYSLFGDNGFVMNSGSLGAGQHEVTALVYEQDGAAVLASGSTFIGVASTITPIPTVTPVLPPPVATRTPTPDSTRPPATPTATSTPIPSAATATSTLTPTPVVPTATSTRTATPTAALPPTATPTLPAQEGSRDKYLWPFSSTSPWNMPIGSSAQYTSANLGTPSGFFFEDEFLYLDPAAPSRTLSGDHHIWPASCTGGGENVQVLVRDGAIIPGGGPSYAPNNTGGALLASNPNVVQEFLASCRNSGTGDTICGVDLRGLPARPSSFRTWFLLCTWRIRAVRDRRIAAGVGTGTRHAYPACPEAHHASFDAVRRPGRTVRWRPQVACNHRRRRVE